LIYFLDVSNLITQKQKTLYKYGKNPSAPVSQETRLQEAIRGHYQQASSLSHEKLNLTQKLLDLVS
jgi:hypothetical protein